MSERMMNIMVVGKDEYKAYLQSRGYENHALEWVDENWENLCDYAESDEQTHLVYPNRIKSYLSHHVSEELDKHEYHCYMERIMWFSVKEMHQLKDAGPHSEDLYTVVTNPILKVNVEDYLLDEKMWEHHLAMLYDQGDWGFNYSKGSAQMIDEGDSFTISYEVY